MVTEIRSAKTAVVGVAVVLAATLVACPCAEAQRVQAGDRIPVAIDTPQDYEGVAPG